MHYKATIQMHHPDNVNNGGWTVKRDPSSFFPDHWTDRKVQAEIAVALENKVLDKGDKYDGFMSDGTKLVMYIRNGVLESAFPEI